MRIDRVANRPPATYPNVEIAFDDVTLEVESVTCFKADGSWLKPLLP